MLHFSKVYGMSGTVIYEKSESTYNLSTLRALCNVCAVFDYTLSQCSVVSTDEDVERLVENVHEHINRMNDIYKGFKNKYQSRLVQDVCDAVTLLTERLLNLPSAERAIVTKLVVHEDVPDEPYLYVVRLHPC